MPDWTAWPFPTDDPYPAYHAAREQASVQWHEQLGAHLVLSYESAAAVLRDPRWSSDPSNSPEMLASMGEEGAGPGLWSKSLLTSDPPAHTRLRSAVNRFFTPRSVRGIQQRVAAIVDSAFAPLAEGAPIELMNELAYPIPLAVIAELFDVGLEGAELLRSQTPTLARMLELDPSAAEREAIGTAAMTVMLFLVPIVAERRLDPGEDLLSAPIHPPEGGVALETDEIITMCLLLLAAGHETTANLIGNGTLALLEHPEQLDWLQRHPELSMQAVDELLRYDSPVQVASRVALVDMVLGESTVSKGQQALVVLGSANRDLIEGEQARHVRAHSCCQRRMQVLRELSLQVEGVLDRRGFYVRVQLIDLGLRKTALGERAEGLGLQAGMENMGGAAELARHDPQARARGAQVGAAQPLA
jgi:cytochrome P450